MQPSERLLQHMTQEDKDIIMKEVRSNLAAAAGLVKDEFERRLLARADAPAADAPAPVAQKRTLFGTVKAKPVAAAEANVHSQKIFNYFPKCFLLFFFHGPLHEYRILN